jgi:GLPGLI family protein
MKRALPYIVTILIVFWGCNGTKEDKKDYSEGTIEYKIIYPQQVIDEGLTMFLPEKMMVFFKDKNLKVRFKGGLGIYHLEYISRSLGDSCFTLFKVFDKKMFYQLNKADHLFLYKDLGSTKITQIPDSTKEIAGVPCQMAKVSFSNAGETTINVYYTQSFDITNPNVNTPFEAIPGILMEFEMAFNDLRLKLMAQKFTPSSLTSDEFEVPGDYRESSAEEVQGMILTLMQ